jgi:dethiobiotin synthetase
VSANGLFITGTDTGCGKTEVTLALMRLYQAQGLRVLGMKPVSAGARDAGEGLRNEDAERLHAAGSLSVPYELVNPYVFEPPVAPHIAAAESGVTIRSEVIADCYRSLAASADLVLVEGVGGWRVPLGEDLQVADLPSLLQLPVLLVVGMRLGCLNHALLSADAIVDRARLVGWLANQVEPGMERLKENIAALDLGIPCPRIGRVGYLSTEPRDKAMAAAIDRGGLALLHG